MQALHNKNKTNSYTAVKLYNYKKNPLIYLKKQKKMNAPTANDKQMGTIKIHRNDCNNRGEGTNNKNRNQSPMTVNEKNKNYIFLA